MMESEANYEERRFYSKDYKNKYKQVLLVSKLKPVSKYPSLEVVGKSITK